MKDTLPTPTLSKPTPSSRPRVLLALTLTALFSGCGKEVASNNPPTTLGMAMPVTAVEIQPQHAPLIIEAVGQAEGSKEIEVRARVSGLLTRQHYREGDRVKAGATLFSIDKAPYEIALAEARAALAQEQANIEQARREATRLKPLIEERAVSQKEYDDAVSALQTSQAVLLAREAAVREAELNLSYTRVSAPLSAVSGRARQSEGSLVTAASDSSWLTTLSVTDPIWVRFAFSESEMQRLRQAGSKTDVRLVLPDGSRYEAPGKVNFTASTVDPATGTVALRAEFPNPNLALLPGQFVRVQVAVGERLAYLVPQSALFQNDQGKLVFTVAADNTVSPRPVETDGWSGHEWIVTSGLAPGDKIITDNLMKLRPGAPVAPHAPGQGPGQRPSRPPSGDAPDTH